MHGIKVTSKIGVWQCTVPLSLLPQTPNGDIRCCHMVCTWLLVLQTSAGCVAKNACEQVHSSLMQRTHKNRNTPCIVCWLRFNLQSTVAECKRTIRTRILLASCRLAARLFVKQNATLGRQPTCRQTAVRCHTWHFRPSYTLSSMPWMLQKLQTKEFPTPLFYTRL